jgi:hypothetical protein
MINVAGDQLADKAPEFTGQKLTAAVSGANEVSGSNSQSIDDVLVNHDISSIS